MPGSPSPSSFFVRITPYLSLVEKILFAALAVGLVLTAMGINSSFTGMVFLALAVTFFVSAYRPLDIPDSAHEKFGFSELLALIIIPKVMWIGSAILALGVAFFIFDFGNEGYRQMLLIGALSVGAAVVLLTYFLMSGVKHLNLVTPMLLRVVPVLLVGLYVLFK
jgi:hypothetical protein